jgi:hypothetical protein
MRYLLIFLFLMLAFSCKQARKPISGSPGDSNLPLDSLVYEQLVKSGEKAGEIKVTAMARDLKAAMATITSA